MPSSTAGPQDAEKIQAHTDPKLRRRLQNRIAQRNSRQRKASQNSSAQYQQNQNNQYHRCYSDPAAIITYGPSPSPIAAEQSPLARSLSSSTSDPLALTSTSTPQAVVTITKQEPQYNVDYTEQPFECQTANNFISSFAFELGPDLSSSHAPTEARILPLDPEPKPFDALGPTTCDSDQETQVAPDHEYDMLSLPLSPRSTSHFRDRGTSSERKWSIGCPGGGGGAQLQQQQQQQKSTSPLHACARTGNGKILEILLRSGADVNAADGEGRTALHLGARGGHEEVVRALLGHKADTGILDARGMSAMHVAVVNNEEQIVILLLEAGVNPNV